MSSQTFLSPISLPFPCLSSLFLRHIEASFPYYISSTEPSSYLLFLSFYSVFLIAGLCPGLFLGVSALINRPSARISLQPEPTCIFQLLNSDCSLSVPLSHWSSVPPSFNRMRSVIASQWCITTCSTTPSTGQTMLMHQCSISR